MHEKTFHPRRAAAHHALLSAGRHVTAWLAHAPYTGVPWAAWLFVVFACLVAGGGPFSGDLVWFDDRVRLVQVFDWLNGAGWYDRTITRVNAPEGFHTIWSRVVDLPTAAIIAALQPLIGQMQAGLTASILLPLVATLLLFFAAPFFAAPLVGRNKARLVVLFVLFGSCINPEAFTLAGFQPGMVGHHSWYVLLTLLFYGAMARLIAAPDNKRMIFVAAAAIGGLLVVGIEGLPLIAAALALVALIGILTPNPTLLQAARRVTIFGAALGFVTLPANQPLAHYTDVSFAEPSILGPVLIACAAAFFTLQGLFTSLCDPKRIAALALGVITAGLIGLGLVDLFPQILDGGAAALSPEERRLAAAEHQEAMGLFHLARNGIDTLRLVLPPLMAMVFGLWHIRHTPPQQRAVPFFMLGLMMGCFALTATYARFNHYLGLTTAPWLLALWLDASARLRNDDTRALKSFGLFMAIGPLWLWLVPAANFNLNFGTSVLLFPAKMQLETQRCPYSPRLTEFLDARYGADTTLMVPMYRSDHFLLHTHLKIFFLANFPSQNKFIDAKAFYETGDDAEAKRIARTHPLDVVAVCTEPYKVSTRSVLTNLLLKNHMSFGQKLVTGQAPDWMTPVPSPDDAWLIYDIDRRKLD